MAGCCSGNGVDGSAMAISFFPNSFGARRIRANFNDSGVLICINKADRTGTACAIIRRLTRTAGSIGEGCPTRSRAIERGPGGGDTADRRA